MKSDLLVQFKSLQTALMQEKARLESRLAEINKLVGAGASHESAGPSGKTRNISTAGRARIAAAQRRRWAKFHSGKPAAAPKRAARKMSAAGRARIIAAQKARWAKFHAAKAE